MKTYQIMMCWDEVGCMRPKVIRRDDGYDSEEEAIRALDALRDSGDYHDFYKSAFVWDAGLRWHPSRAVHWIPLNA